MNLTWQQRALRANLALTEFGRKIPHALCDLAGYAGAGLITYGCYVYAAALGFVVGGALLIAAAMLIGRRLNANDSGKRA